MEPQNNLGIDELVDSGADILEAGDQIATALADGFQITDLGTLLVVSPKIQEIVRDRKQAVAELLDLTPEEATEAARRIAERTGHSSSSIILKVNQAFSLLARTYGQYKEVNYLAADWVNFAKSFSQTAA